MLTNLFLDKNTSDITLVSSDSKSFYAHKFILRDASVVFEELLEKDINEIKIDIDYIGLNNIVRILYEQSWVPTNFNDSIQIYSIFKKFQIGKYINVILDDIKDNMTFENALFYFQKDDLDQDILEFSLGILARNYHFLKVEDFEFKDIIRIYKDDGITEFVLKWVKENDLDLDQKKEIVSRYLKFRKPLILKSFYTKNVSKFSNQLYERIFKIIDQ